MTPSFSGNLVSCSVQLVFNYVTGKEVNNVETKQIDAALLFHLPLNKVDSTWEVSPLVSITHPAGMWQETGSTH